MNSVFKKLLDDLKKANQVTKQKMAVKYGFKKVEDFEKYLTSEPASNPNPPVPAPTTRKRGTKKVTTTVVTTTTSTPPMLHNVHILDASGSMAGGKIKNAIHGINEEIEELKKNPDAEYTTQSIVDFSYSADIKFRTWKTPIKDAQPFNCGVRGSTALLEAIGVVLTKLLEEYKVDEKVLVKIFTDGGENDSAPEWKFGTVPNLIKECEAKGFVITFVGTSQDVTYAVNALHVKLSNTLVHDNSEAGVKASFKKSIGSTVKYRTAASRGTDTKEDFFS